MRYNRCFACMEPLPDPDGFCPRCGCRNRDTEAAQPGYVLRCGTMLNEQRYVLGRMLGQGGFGISYIAYDRTLALRVCLKEYFPRTQAVRSSESSAVFGIASDSARTLEQGRESFVREARKAVKLRDLRSVVKVWDVFYANGTAYIVMDYIEGVTLTSFLRSLGRPLDERETVRLFDPVMEDLSKIHERELIHRDISPDNLMRRPDGSLVLLDLGAARDLSGSAQTSELVAKNGFSPAEQYMSGGRIGPWTDVYALCATIVTCTTGRRLPTPLERLSGTPLDLSGLSPALAKVLEKGLRIRAEERFQSMAELRAALNRAVGSGRKAGLALALGVALGVCALAAALIALKPWQPRDREEPAEQPLVQEIVVIQTTAPTGWMSLLPTPEPTPEPVPKPTPEPTPEATPKPAPEPTPAPEQPMPTPPAEPLTPLGNCYWQAMVLGYSYSDSELMHTIGETHSERHDPDGGYRDGWSSGRSESNETGYDIGFYYADGLLYYAEVRQNSEVVIKLFYWGSRFLSCWGKGYRSADWQYSGSELYTRLTELANTVYRIGAK